MKREIEKDVSKEEVVRNKFSNMRMQDDEEVEHF